MFAPRRIVIGAAVLILTPAAILGWWLFSPLFIDEEVNEPFPLAAGAVIPEGMTVEEVDGEMTTVAGTDVEASENMSDAMRDAIALKSGEFSDIDRLHQGSGEATIYELADGSRVLRFENLDVTNGPDLRVLLARHENPRSRDLLDEGGYVELAGLKGNIGNQNYEIPPEVDVDEFNSVVIYCAPFHVIFSVAALVTPVA